MIFNKRRRSFHASRVKLPFVNMSASWFLVSTYWISILGSKFILSKNQSRATLWVLDTCLIAVLLPLNDHFDHSVTIFKSVQLSFELRRICVCGDVIHMRQLINISVFPSVWGWICDFANSFLLRDWLVVWYCSMNVNTSITTSHNSRARNPSIRSPEFNEMLSDSVELWDIAFVSYTSNK